MIARRFIDRVKVGYEARGVVVIRKMSVVYCTEVTNLGPNPMVKSLLCFAVGAKSVSHDASGTINRPIFKPAAAAAAVLESHRRRRGVPT